MTKNILLPFAVSATIFTHATAKENQKVPDNVRAIIEKTQSFGLGRYPISFWNYTNLKEHGQYMDEAEVEEWADAGFTVPQSSNYDANDPRQKAHILRLLDWAHERGMKLILFTSFTDDFVLRCDSRCYARRSSGGQGELISPDYVDSVRAAVEDFGSHPATFGFHVGDEPGADMKETFFACYRVQKEIAPIRINLSARLCESCEERSNRKARKVFKHNVTDKEQVLEHWSTGAPTPQRPNAPLPQRLSHPKSVVMGHSP